MKTSTKRGTFSQFYTNKEISDYVCKLITTKKDINSVIDLGVGEGSLLKSIKAKYESVKSVGVDIDRKNIEHLSNSGAVDFLYCFDSTVKTNIEELIYKHGTFDVVVGNPPYNRTAITSEIRQSFEILKIFENHGLSKIGSDIVFLIHGLLLLSDNGILIYILPDGFTNNIIYAELREYLFDNYKVEKIVEIPEKSFIATEAKTHLLVARKGLSSSSVEISKLNLGKVIKINKDQFVERCDYSFLDRPRPINFTKLKELNVDVFRGNKSTRYLSDLSIPYIHTSNMSCGKVEETHTNNNNGLTLTEKGDIAIARVGSRVVGKFCVVANSNVAISDCIIIIRSKDETTRDRIINSLKMDVSKVWLSSIKKGVGAKHITIKDIMEMPIY
ncbi:N-6 DNA methylase [Vibrio chemaguriensis]